MYAYARGKGKNLEKLLEYSPDPLIEGRKGVSLASLRDDIRAVYAHEPGYKFGEPFEEISDEILAKLDKSIEEARAQEAK